MRLQILYQKFRTFYVYKSVKSSNVNVLNSETFYFNKFIISHLVLKEKKIDLKTY